MKKALCVAGVVSILSLSAVAQNEEAPREPRIYELKARPAAEISRLLVGFISESIPNSAFNTVTVTATPAEHAVVASLINRFDVAPAELEFQLYILKASQGGNGAPPGVPADIAAIVQEVRALTRYDRFELLDSPVLRTIEGPEGGELSGDGPFAYSLGVRRTNVSRNGEKAEISVGEFELKFQLLTGYRQGVLFFDPEDVPEDQRRSDALDMVWKRAGLSTSFKIEDGERIVLGASRIQGSEDQKDLAIVTVVEARLLN